MSLEATIEPERIGIAPSLLTPIVAGVSLGLAAWGTDELGFPWTAVIPTNAIGAWLGVAFALGATAGSKGMGAFRGLLALLAAVGAYYLAISLTASGVRSIGASHAAAIWGAVALLAGPLLGGAGATWRRGAGWPRVVAVTLLAAGLCAEAIAFGAPRWAHPDQLFVDPGAITLAAEAVLGFALPFVLLSRGERLRGVAALAVLTLIAGLILYPAIALLRFLADRF